MNSMEEDTYMIVDRVELGNISHLKREMMKSLADFSEHH